MLLPNVSAMYKWVNDFFPAAPNGSQDFLQIIRASDGTVLGWIDENGIPRGSLAQGGGGGGSIAVVQALVSFSGTSGVLPDIPDATFLMLTWNGVTLTDVGPAPDYSISGLDITLTVAATDEDTYIAWFLFGDGGSGGGGGTTIGPVGTGNGSSGELMLTTLRGSGTGPANPTAVVGYAQVILGSSVYWMPLFQ